MSRSRIDHPTREGVYAAYGVDHMLGPFVELFHESREEPIAVLDVFTIGESITVGMALDFLVDHGFFSADDVEECTELVRSGSPRPRRLVPLSYLLVLFWAETGGGPTG